MTGYLKVLFVCRANVGRSQMAEAIFNKLAGKKAIATSAGTFPGGYKGKLVGDVAPMVTKCMKDYGIDISKNRSKILTSEAIKNADIVVSMIKKDMLPPYLRKSKKLIIIPIKDPRDIDYEGHIAVRDTILKMVKEFIDNFISNKADNKL